MNINNENWERLSAIYSEALLLKPEKRKAYLQKQMKNSDEIKLLLGMLQDNSHSSKFLDAIEHGINNKLMGADKYIGRQLGNYKIIDQIGSGGMSHVFLAERNDEIYEQQVAIKILKLHLSDTAQRQFIRERQILSNLDHAGIAKIFDGGILEDGTSYYVMELVEGLSLFNYVNRHELNLNARITLFQKFCKVVEYAHQNLIIHRDIKPSNILVTSDGNIKLLDFGIAKILQQDTDTQVTRQGITPLTISYASPEQIESKPLGTQSDVFSLGRLLYQLLSGSTPYSESATAYEQVDLLIKNGITHASKSKTDIEFPKTVFDKNNLLRGDLDNIISKAMQYDLNDRYLSVSEFYNDIERYISNLPVIASTTTPLYHFKKYVKRNPLIFSLSITLGATILFFSSFILKNNLEIKAQNEALTQEQIKTQRVSDALIDTLRFTDPENINDKNVSAISLLRDAQKNILELNDLNNEEKSLLLYEIAKLQENILDQEGLLISTDHAIQVTPNLNNSEFLAELYLMRAEAKNVLRQHTEAKKEAQNALELLTKNEIQHHELLAHAYNEIANVNLNTGNIDAAEKNILQALSHYAEYDAPTSKLAVVKGNLSFVYMSRAEFSKASEVLQEVCPILINNNGEKNKDSLSCLTNTGTALRLAGQFKAAREKLEYVLTLRESVVSKDHPSLLSTLNSLGNVYRSLGDTAQSTEFTLRTHQISQQVFAGAVEKKNRFHISYILSLLDEKRFTDVNDELSKLDANDDSEITKGSIRALKAELELNKKNWSEALNLSEQAFTIFENKIPQRHESQAWINGLYAYALFKNGENSKAQALAKSGQARLNKSYTNATRYTLRNNEIFSSIQ